MAKEKMTPEERLLKIIENPQGSSDLKKDIKKQKIKFNIKRWFISLKNLKPKKIKFKMPTLNLQFVNKALIILLVIVFALFIFDFIRDKLKLNQRFKVIEEFESGIDEIQEEAQAKINLAGIVREAKKRNIFTLTETASVDETTPAKPEKKISNLKLVGILWSNNPQVMIEDTQDNNTYFVSEGQDISGWKVKKIYQDRVILENKEGEWELR